MKILHILDSGGVFGKERVVLELLKGMLDVANVINLSNIKDFEKEVLMFCSFCLPISHGLNDKESLKLLKTEIAKGDLDIIHCHDYKSSFYVMWYSFLHPSLKTKIVRTLHGYTTTSKLSKMFLYQTLDKFLLYFHDKVISVKPDMGYDTILNGISPPDVRPIGLDSEIIEFCTTNKVIIGTTGRLSKEKNYAALIIAIAGLYDVNLIIFGNGPERDNLENLIEYFNLQDRVMMPGFVYDPARYYSLLDVYIQPSFTEGLPISVLEAAACTKLLVLTLVGGMKLFIDANAALKTETDEEDMVHVLEVAIKNLDKLDDVADKAKALFEQKFSAKTMVENYVNLYDRLVAKEQQKSA